MICPSFGFFFGLFSHIEPMEKSFYFCEQRGSLHFLPPHFTRLYNVPLSQYKEIWSVGPSVRGQGSGLFRAPALVGKRFSHENSGSRPGPGADPGQGPGQARPGKRCEAVALRKFLRIAVEEPERHFGLFRRDRKKFWSLSKRPTEILGPVEETDRNLGPGRGPG